MAKVATVRNGDADRLGYWRRAGMKGGARFDAWRAGKPVLEPVKPNISARRAELNENLDARAILIEILISVQIKNC